MIQKIEEIYHFFIYKYEKYCIKKGKRIFNIVYSDLLSTLHQMQMTDGGQTEVKYSSEIFILSKSSWIIVEIAIPPYKNIYLSFVSHNSHNSPLKRHKSKIIREIFKNLVTQTKGEKFWVSGNNCIYECRCN